MKRSSLKVLGGLIAAASAWAQPAQGGAALHCVPIEDVRIDDAFWSPKRDVWRNVTIADCFDKFEKDGALANFDAIRDGKAAEHGGAPWFDGLVYETITGAADFLRERPDPRLELRIDGYIQRIAAAAAKDPDGYLNTYTQLKEPNHRWGANGGNDRWQHDLYNAGCLVEAAVHYYRATGKTELLAVAAKLANHMCDVMGPPPKKNIIPGHALGEATLVELYELFREQPDLKKKIPVAVDESRYLTLAQFWIDNRGNHAGRESFGAYNQDDRPVAEQETIEGHAVRATLLASAMESIASVADRDDYRRAAGRMWENMTHRRMYVTGGVGAVAGDEKFGADYALPNTGYLETCAAVGAAFFHHQMSLGAGHARFADELERVLYNSALCGVSLAGNRYFYENPLEAGKGRERWAWHACPCCPPMFLKLMGAFPSYIYAANDKGIYVNLYVGSHLRTKVAGQAVALRQVTEYPWEGNVRLTIESDAPVTIESAPVEFALNLRIPGWAQGGAVGGDLYNASGPAPRIPLALKINNEAAPIEQVDGYARIRRQWKKGDVVEIQFDMPAQRIVANPKVEADVGKIALSRGPIIYCLESADNQGRLRSLSLPNDAKLTAQFRADLLGGVTVIAARAMSSSLDAAPTPTDIVAVPYYANANRGPVSMCVWIPTSPKDAAPASAAESASPSASHTFANDTVDALNDGRAPKSSDDETIPRFTWWDHRGTAEWAQYKFEQPTAISGASVYWWDERRVGRHCRTPASWRIVYRTAAGEWAPVRDASGYGVELDKFNHVTFDPIQTTAIRIEAQLQPEWSAGILEWQLEQPTPGKSATPGETQK